MSSEVALCQASISMCSPLVGPSIIVFYGKQAGDVPKGQNRGLPYLRSRPCEKMSSSRFSAVPEF